MWTRIHHLELRASPHRKLEPGSSEVKQNCSEKYTRQSSPVQAALHRSQLVLPAIRLHCILSCSAHHFLTAVSLNTWTQTMDLPHRAKSTADNH